MKLKKENINNLNTKRYIVIKPNKNDKDVALKWLREEYEQIGEGFYCNKSIIEEALKREELIILKENDNVVGLAVWSEYEKKQVTIEIFVIQPRYRNQGLGTFFYKEISNYFKNNGNEVIKLFCSPESSKKFWKNNGFIKFPKIERSDERLWYYQTLINIASMEECNEKDKIELWNIEPDESYRKRSKWRWYVNINAGKLELPIIFPCNCNWKMRWSKNGKTIKEGKVKYFTKNEYELYKNPFLYIRSLKNI